MIGDLFDSPWKVAIVAIVLIVLFGSKKLPHAARSLGQSMRILKTEVSGLHQEEPEDKTSGPPPAAQLAAGELAAPQPEQQSQIDALQQQIRDLQRAATMDPVTPDGMSAESRPSQPS